MRGLKGTSQADGQWLLALLIVLAAGLALALATTMLLRASRLRRIARSFRRQIIRAGLSREEALLVARIARLAGLRRPDTIFAAPLSFDSGAGYLMDHDRLMQLNHDERIHLSGLVESLRTKLGFAGSTGVPPVGTAETAVLPSSRQIRPGTSLTLVPMDYPYECPATLAASTDSEMVVKPDLPLECRRGQIVLVRVARGARLWEFDAPVIEDAGWQIRLGHSQTVRIAERRRFPRVPISRSALLAPFPFLKTDFDREEPVFLPVALTEIAGPGLRFEGPVATQVGAKVLVVTVFSDRRAVQGIGRVIRATPDRGSTGVPPVPSLPPFTGGTPVLQTVIVELTDLNAQDISELVRQTNDAARGNAVAQASRLSSSGTGQRPVVRIVQAHAGAQHA